MKVVSGISPIERPKEASNHLAGKTDTTPRRSSAGHYDHVKSRISPEETQKYFKRREEREYQRLRELADKEISELQECTFRPNIRRKARIG
jgi:hypothetical protein